MNCFFFLFKNNAMENLPRNKARSRQNEQVTLYIKEDCQYATFLLIPLLLWALFILRTR